MTEFEPTPNRGPSFRVRVGTAVRPRRQKPPNDIDELPDPTSGDPSPGGRRWGSNDRQFWTVSATYETLPPGIYKPTMAQNVGPMLLKQHISVDDLLTLPDDEVISILEEYASFWQLRAEFRKRGFLCKRGFLLWGPPGSGKTSCLQLMMQRLTYEMGGIAIFIEHPGIAGACLQMLRGIESERPVICIMEDIDALVDQHDEQSFLALLDGEAQVDNVVFVATTNYPERLDARFVDRPSRFDTIRYIGMPSAAARRFYLEHKEPELTADEVDEWVKLSDGFSIAHLKEMIIAIRCFGQPLTAVIKRLDDMHGSRPKSSDAPDKPSFSLAQRAKELANGERK